MSHKILLTHITRIVFLSITVCIISILHLINHSYAEASSPTITLGVSTVGEGDDFSTRVLGIPWDMNTEPYPGISTMFNHIDLDSFVMEDSYWKMNTDDPNGANMWLHWTGINNTQEVLKTGIRFPIDTNKYKLLSFYLCSTESTYANLYWFFDQAPHTDFSISRYITVDPGCKLYTMHLDIIDKYEGEWDGAPIGLRLDPVNQSTSFMMRWVRLTTVDHNNIVPIHYSNFSSSSTVHFYASFSGCGIDGIPIGFTSASDTNTFNWGETLQPNPTLKTPYPLPESLEPGLYTIYALENDQGSPQCADTQIEIHSAPILTFQKPSYFSGPDYATEVVGDPWGMSNSEDVIDMKDIASAKFNNGILEIKTSDSGNHLKLNVTEPINTNKYKYITARYYVEGIRDIEHGWVQKYIWWYEGPAVDPVTSRPTIIEEGWHSYSFNLSEAPTEPGGSWANSPRGFRFDPVEISDPTKIYIDYILLTGDEIIKAGQPFNIYFETTSENANIHFYYDNDKNPNNGRTRITEKTNMLNLENFNHHIFVPVVSNFITTAYTHNEINLIDGQKYIWDTSGVSPGTYYVSADVDDGVMTTTWYSELPVIIK